MSVLLALAPMASLSHMLALPVLTAPVDLEFLPVELAHFRSLVLLELVPMVSLSHMLALLVLMAPVDLES
ncbi:hypothetical protein D8819_10380 [Streptococcus gordonii]|nr:hypothetical protein D8819_10380 [Streptococcus gordonii]